MVERHQRLCVRAGVCFLPLFFLGLVIAGWVPPPAPSLPTEDVARMFRDDAVPIRIGVFVLTASTPVLAAYVAALSHQLGRIAPGSPLVTVQTVAGACLLLEFIFPQMIWQAAAYRAGRSPEVVQTLNDIGWLMYIGVVCTAMAQMIVIAIVVLQDRAPVPLLPRWTAYVCLWAALGVAGGGFCVFVQAGPVAWNGVISFWLLAVSFFVWMVVMTWGMLRASHRIDRGEPRTSPVADPTRAPAR